MSAERRPYRQPPPGWMPFGSHADEGCPCAEEGPLTFSDERGEDLFPLWERHDGCLWADDTDPVENGPVVQPAEEAAEPIRSLLCHKHDEPNHVCPYATLAAASGPSTEASSGR